MPDCQFEGSPVLIRKNDFGFVRLKLTISNCDSFVFHSLEGTVGLRKVQFVSVIENC